MLLASSCGKVPAKHDYGVFLGVTEDLELLQDYKTVVIDAQFFTAKEISEFKASGHEVLTYINIGSLENWRDYYDEDLTLDVYENWEEERWVDVSREEWQEFITDELIPELLDKDIDGFLVDNCDVYYHYPTEAAANGRTLSRESIRRRYSRLFSGMKTGSVQQIQKITNTSRITSSAMQSRAQTFTFWNIRLTRT